jgi:hypothetical protein
MLDWLPAAVAGRYRLVGLSLAVPASIGGSHGGRSPARPRIFERHFTYLDTYWDIAG